MSVSSISSSSSSSGMVSSILTYMLPAAPSLHWTLCHTDHGRGRGVQGRGGAGAPRARHVPLQPAAGRRGAAARPLPRQPGQPRARAQQAGGGEPPQVHGHGGHRQQDRESLETLLFSQCVLKLNVQCFNPLQFPVIYNSSSQWIHYLVMRRRTLPPV